MSVQLQPGGPRPASGHRGPQGGQEEEEEDGDLDDEQDASRLQKFMRERRRARSLPAYPALLDADSGGRRRVTFADSLGLNLASVKTFSTLEEPRVPNKVLSRHRSFPPQQQPLADPDPDPELDLDPGRVRRLRVCLERVRLSRVDLRGHIRVLSPGDDGQVGVRCTFNDWLSHVDTQAEPEPEPGSAEPPDSVGERFGFRVDTPPLLEPGAAVSFAVFLRSREGEFWDNNEGHNYTVRYRCPAACSAAFRPT